MYVIAKMAVSSIEDYGFSRKFKLSCVYDNGINTGDNPENRSFTKASPSGECWMTVDNQHVWSAFRIPRIEDGKQVGYPSNHYVVFIDAEEHTLEDVHRALAALNA